MAMGSNTGGNSKKIERSRRNAEKRAARAKKNKIDTEHIVQQPKAEYDYTPKAKRLGTAKILAEPVVEKEPSAVAQILWTGERLGLVEAKKIVFRIANRDVGNNGQVIGVSVHDGKQSSLVNTDVYVTIGQLHDENFLTKASKLNETDKKDQQALWTCLHDIVSEAGLVPTKKLVGSHTTTKHQAPKGFTKPRLATSNGQTVPLLGTFINPKPLANGFITTPNGHWKTDDSVVLRCRPGTGFVYVNVVAAPNDHPLNNYKPFIKLEHLQVGEKSTLPGKELRDYLRTKLAEVGEMQLPIVVKVGRRVSA
jgi:hypothetical protein